MSKLSVRDFFQADHNRLDKHLAEFRRLKRTDYAKAKENFREFKFGLQRHIIWEENILFPRFEDKTGMREFGPTVVMRSEHRQIGACLEALHQKVQRHDPESDAEEERLLEILTLHNQKEENVLYPALDQVLSDEEKALVKKEMDELPEEAYRTCCGGHHH